DLVLHCRDRNIRHVHCHSFADAAHVCAMAWRMGGPTYSLTLHGDLPVYGTDHRSKLSGCTAVGCDGPHLVPQLVEIGYPEEKVRPNWMGVDTDRFVPGELPRPDDDVLRAITVARLNRNKGHRFALRALRGLLDDGIHVQYTLVGEGGFRDEIKSEIRRLKMEQHVRLLGTMGEDDVRRELQSADVFCLPSVGLGEAGPISAMEAMACGLPVVASIIGATASMIDDGVTGFLCEQENVDQLRDAFKTLAKDADRRQTMGRAARGHAVDQFDSRRTSLRLFEHIRHFTPQTFK
ncbi:MAG: glycosyltransferase family 4 protein, partial [Planctomycetota bacterium]